MSNGYKEYVSSDYVVQHTPMIQDDTFTKIIKALSNTDYTIKQVRNIFLIAEGSDLPVGEPGDICLVFSNE